MSAPVTKAVLLAAGKGTRMRELTNELPKPMIEVQGKPILLHIVEGLRAAGVTHFLIVVGYRAEVVRAFFGDGSKLGVAVEYETQVVQDGTGRVVELAKTFAGADPFEDDQDPALHAASENSRIRFIPAASKFRHGLGDPALQRGFVGRSVFNQPAKELTHCDTVMVCGDLDQVLGQIERGRPTVGQMVEDAKLPVVKGQGEEAVRRSIGYLGAAPHQDLRQGFIGRSDVDEPI